MKITLKERLQEEAAGVLGYLLMALGAVVLLVLAVGGAMVDISCFLRRRRRKGD